MFYACGEDLHYEMFAHGDLPYRELISGLLQDTFIPMNTALPIGSDLKFGHISQDKDFDIRSTTLKNIFAQLELTHKLIRVNMPVNLARFSFRRRVP